MNEPNWIPDKDYMILQPELIAEKSEGGIIIPEQARRVLNEGVILKVGPLCSPHLKPGVRVVFTNSSDFSLKMEGDKTVSLVQETNVLMYAKSLPSLPPPITLRNNVYICVGHNWDGDSPCPKCKGKESVALDAPNGRTLPKNMQQADPLQDKRHFSSLSGLPT